MNQFKKIFISVDSKTQLKITVSFEASRSKIDLKINPNDRILLNPTNKTNAQIHLKRFLERNLKPNEKAIIVAFSREESLIFNKWLTSCSCDLNKIFHFDFLIVQDLAKWLKYDLDYHFNFLENLEIETLSDFFFIVNDSRVETLKEIVGYLREWV